MGVLVNPTVVYCECCTAMKFYPRDGDDAAMFDELRQLGWAWIAYKPEGKTWQGAFWCSEHIPSIWKINQSPQFDTASEDNA